MPTITVESEQLWYPKGMRLTFLILLSSLAVAADETELWIVGDQSEPVRFVVLPFDYSGEKTSPTVLIEDTIKQALSSTGLLSMPSRVSFPENPHDMYYWQFNNVRYVIHGHIFEQDHQLLMKISVYDSYGLEPMDASMILIPDQLQFSLQQAVDRLYRSIFYATFTGDIQLRYLYDEDTRLTAYLHQLIQVFKFNWNSAFNGGMCDVNLEQLPGGTIFEQRLGSNCFQTDGLAEEIEETLTAIDPLPYDRYRKQFQRKLKLHFIHPDSDGRKIMMRMQNDKLVE
ncbi:hypothetical protein [Marinicella sp. W31]|uniref:hypothetical protein n=1 Tax=Marinicella sp. W31 TaxID=3023713 RepID=UPI003756429F